jgi:hypothetical protein
LDESRRRQRTKGYMVETLEDLQQGTGKKAAPPINLPELILPCDSYTIDQSGQVAYTHFQQKHLFFRQGRTVKRINLKATNGEWLETVSAENFRGILGKHFNCQTIIQGQRGDYKTAKLCSADKARGLLASDTVLLLDPIQVVLKCPIFVENSHGLKILGKGYHPENGGVYVMTDMTIDENVSLEDAKKSLLEVINEFLFVTPSDKSRCLAEILAPAFRFGRLLQADFPLLLNEATSEQTGKTHLVKLVRTLYNETPYPITTGDKFLDEKLSAGMESGAGMLALDNIRGLINSPLFESAVRGEGNVSTRQAYSKVTKSETGHIIWLATSNKAELTADLAARSLIVRLNKQPKNYKWKVYPEGDHLKHVQMKLAHFLACVFAIIREWYKAGKPKTAPVDHDFREFCGVMDWCVTQLLGQEQLLLGHREEQMRMSNPDLNWMRDVAIEVGRQGKLDRELDSGDIMKICDEAAMPILNLEHWNKNIDREYKLPSLLGQQLSRLFKKAADGVTLTLGSYRVIRKETQKYDPHRQENRTTSVYIFDEIK